MLLAMFIVGDALCTMPAVAQAIMISRLHCMQYLRSIFRRWLHLAETALLRHGAQPRTLFFLAALSAFDSFFPMLPAEAFVVALGILQPKKSKLIVLVFAMASALSALLLALVLGTLSSSAERLGLQLMGAQWDQALAMVRTWGPASMVFLAAFPDSPRTSIAALALSGVAPLLICLMVFLGKLILYAALLGLMHDLPSRLGRWRNAEAKWKRWLQRRASRFVAYCRRIRWLARHPDQRSSPS
jgi:membrane protein YqaA with SNARE-associated domain